MDKKALYLGATIGGLIGGYLPTLFGQSGFGIWAILGSTLGGILGIIAMFKFMS